MKMKYFGLIFFALFYFTKGQGPECGPNEHPKFVCSPTCNPEPTCQDPHPTKQPGFCPLYCIDRCECNDGYIRCKPNGACIKKQDCPHARSVRENCPINQVYLCTSPCHPIPTCQNRHPVPPPGRCGGLCIRRCVCDLEKGYFENEKNGQCVKEKDCPSD